MITWLATGALIAGLLLPSAATTPALAGGVACAQQNGQLPADQPISNTTGSGEVEFGDFDLKYHGSGNSLTWALSFPYHVTQTYAQLAGEKQGRLVNAKLQQGSYVYSSSKTIEWMVLCIVPDPSGAASGSRLSHGSITLWGQLAPIGGILLLLAVATALLLLRHRRGRQPKQPPVL